MSDTHAPQPDHGHSDAPAARAGVPIDVSHGYETSDVRNRVIVLSVIGLAVSVAIIQLISVGVNDALDSYVVHDQALEYGLDTRPHHAPPDPQLQPSPGHHSLDREDMFALRSEQLDSLIKPDGWERPVLIRNQDGTTQSGSLVAMNEQTMTLLASTGEKVTVERKDIDSWQDLGIHPTARLLEMVGQELSAPATQPAPGPSTPQSTQPAAADQNKGSTEPGASTQEPK